MANEKEKTEYMHIEINIWYLLIIIIGILCAIYIGIWIKSNNENKKILEEISIASVTLSDEQIIDNKKIEKYNVDFNALKSKNKDTVGWLKVKGTNIEYPVVQYSNNSYYIDHNYENKYNCAGWIFVDYRNKLDGSDKNTVIYGHNIKDGSMFGTLKNILKSEWQENEENRYIIFETENESQVYNVFSVYTVEAEEYYLKTNFFNETEFTDFINTIKQRSIKDFDVEVTSDDTILTLSTCADNNKYRVVLHAKKISTNNEN